ncbi:MAG TPA: ROK family protein [Candidatus Binataceae bacterium]|nr:ROK family protein [Candidatus Binataceae bacterium]
MRIGVDLGGTKIEAIALGDDGGELIRRRIATPSGDYAATLDAIAALVTSIEGKLGRTGSVGIGTPGAISPRTGLIKNSNSVVLNGRPLDHDLAAKLARPIRMENDANCFALSEAVDGAARDASVVFGVILGTGVGGGIVIDKRVVAGRNRIAGEWGHNPIPWPTPNELPGPACYCGKTGCLETFLSGPGLAREFRIRTGRGLDANQIAAAADAGDNDAIAMMETYEDRLARGLAHVINIVDPDVIVLGGGLSNIAGLYGNLLALIQRYAFSDGIETPVVRAMHGDSSGVRGAAWLWPA